MGDSYKTTGLPAAPGSLMGNAVLYTPKEREWLMGKLEEIKNAVVPSSIQQQYAAYKEDPTKALAQPPQSTSDLIGQLAAAMPIAFHGSPQKFEKFSMEKIGTGQGAQTYGHGLYFAENPKTADWYKQNLASASVKRTYQGQELPVSSPEWVAATRLDPRGMTLEKARAESQRLIDTAGFGDDVEYEKTILAALNKFQSKKDLTRGTYGEMYKVNIPDEHVAKMLDYDKPLKEQAPEIIKKLEDFYNKPISKIGKSVSDLPIDNPTGTKWLSDLGIPGIKYLDQSSRAAGKGTRNFVVFDPNIVEMMK